MEVSLSRPIRSDCVGWDSSAWERVDLGGIAEDDRSQVQNKQNKIVFIHKVVDLWNSVSNNVVIIHNYMGYKGERTSSWKKDS